MRRAVTIGDAMDGSVACWLTADPACGEGRIFKHGPERPSSIRSPHGQR